MRDLVLAIAHHLLVFSIVAKLLVERALLKTPVIEIRRLARLDVSYGATAGLILVVGVCRVVWGGRGWAFYEANPYFWAKLATFLIIGLLSLAPTVRFLAWRKALAADPDFQPGETDVRRVRTATAAQGLLFIPLIGFAAAMARWPF